jgi:hypothetical protein
MGAGQTQQLTSALADLLGLGTDKAPEDRTMFDKIMWGGWSGGGSTTVNQDVQINVRTNDPERAASIIGSDVQNQMRDAQDQAQRGGQ